MRILIPARPVPDSFATNVAHALKALGHEVVLGSERGRHYWRPGLLGLPARLYNQVLGTTLEEQRWVRMVEKMRPAMVVSLTRSFSDAALTAMRRAGVQHLVVWWGDPPANMQREGVGSDLWDAVFLKDRFAVERLRTVGVNAHLLHEAMNPAWHHPVQGPRQDEAVFVGNAYRARQLLIRRLLRDGYPVTLYGGRVPRWAVPEVQRVYQGHPVFGVEKSRVFHQAATVINNMSWAEGDSLNCRAFEAAGAGAVQIMEWRPVIEECFEPGKEILVYRTYEELRDHIDRARHGGADMGRLREAAARRARAEHTYRHRLERIFDVLGIPPEA